MNAAKDKPIYSDSGPPSAQTLWPTQFDASVFPPRERDELFVRMLDAYRGSGGLCRGAQVSALLEGRGRHTAGTVDKWMDNNEVIYFEWQLETWLPRFQFDMATKSPRAEVGLVAIELAGVFDNWGMALWFARPSSALNGRLPADTLLSNPDLVIQAARRDRSLAA